MTRRIFCKVLLVVVAIFGVLVLSGVLLAQGRSEDALEHAKNVQEKHTDILMARPGVVGTAVGFNDNGEYAVLVLLERPGVAGIPQELESVPVQVVVTGEILALTTGRYDRPVPIGVSTGHPDITAGTIGCRVKDGEGNVYALSNNHVYADENNAEIGDAVIQPGTFDGGSSPADDIGTLAAFEPIVFHPRARNTIDAAIALSSTSLLGNATPDGGYGTPSSTTVEAALGMSVQKYGRTTGLRAGTITGINASVRVGYDSGTARFVEQIIIEPGGFSAGGDSGSLIVTNDESCNPVGLLFAGSSTVTVANRIDLVLTRFGVTVDGDDTPPPPPNDPPTVSITSPADGSTFGSGASILFEGTASDPEEGDLTDGLDWISSIDGPIGTGGSFSTTLSNGNHTITATATDSDLATGTDSISITVGTPPSGDINVESIVFSCKVAGPNKFLYTTVKVVDGDGLALGGVRVEMTLTHDSADSWNFAGDTGTDGTVKFTLGKAPSGDYQALVTNLTGETLAYCTLNDDGTIDQQP